jgi:hypothetical protein
MARVINHNTEHRDVRMTRRQRERALAALRAAERANPLRRVRLNCAHGWVRDATAAVDQWLFCDKDGCGELRRVVEVAE